MSSSKRFTADSKLIVSEINDQAIKKLLKDAKKGRVYRHRYSSDYRLEILVLKVLVKGSLRKIQKTVRRVTDGNMVARLSGDYEVDSFEVVLSVFVGEDTPKNLKKAARLARNYCPDIKIHTVRVVNEIY